MPESRRQSRDSGGSSAPIIHHSIAPIRAALHPRRPRAAPRQGAGARTAPFPNSPPDRDESGRATSRTARCRRLASGTPRDVCIVHCGSRRRFRRRRHAVGFLPLRRYSHSVLGDRSNALRFARSEQSGSRVGEEVRDVRCSIELGGRRVRALGALLGANWSARVDFGRLRWTRRGVALNCASSSE
jgi:hypothetical protein